MKRGERHKNDKALFYELTYSLHSLPKIIFPATRHESTYISLILTRYYESINDYTNDDILTSTPCHTR